ncbi:NAD(P)/FAD-dependent oxidoreductase [Streptomyces lanatus]|uniref:FAD-dependent oxidoreductase n=1 Tax=Streptomyces lanatus TaxID=66900 RepID=A0ABV1XT56_9ACTN|nr:FAD-dependent oxidoreductase [Streptomyces lanatus]GHH09861.1 D-amino-acid dehydrogenase [Streptomyces lanatus]
MKTTVIGAGVIGLACAYELSELGHEVTVVDAGTAGAAASAGNAGWITPFLSMPRAAPGAVRDALSSFTSAEGPARMRPHLEAGFASWVLRFLLAGSRKRSARATAALQRFSRHALEHVDSLLDRGVEFEHHTDGLAVVFKQAANLENYRRTAARMRTLGYDGTITVHRGSDVTDFDPAISSEVAGVLHLESERHVRPESLSQGLAKSLLNNGGSLIEGEPVRRILPQRTPGTWTVVTAGGKEIPSDHVVVAAGYATRALLKPLGVTVPLEAAKGTSMTARGEGIAPSHPLKLYENMVACSPFDDGVRLSGTFDIGRRDFALNRRRLDMVVRHGLSYLADWRPTETRSTWVGHRPTSVDDTPIIGPVAGRPGLYLATGHGTLGVSLAPVTGALAAREIAGRGEQSELTPFRLSRFGARAVRPATL